ncbi:MAG: ferritin-like domain-containing protein [Gallionella sp.]|nr:ferritin-like domain-containing protein [Gallionella sp.]
MSEHRAELRRAALFWLSETDPVIKAAGVRQLAQDWAAGGRALDAQAVLSAERRIPGIPDSPELVAPRLVKRRSMVSVEGRAILIHALVHIEFNAINLALDAIWRFADMPPAYYTDWLQVADEEALHFSLLAGHLQTLGHDYGDFPAHSSLWEMADKTRLDVLARMALVPRTMEARGLDAVPALRDKLAQAGDLAAAAIMDIILRDEVGHVAIGNRWYGYLCGQRGLDMTATYADLAVKHAAPVLRGPFNFPARRAAGFTEAELAALTGQADDLPS